MKSTQTAWGREKYPTRKSAYYQEEKKKKKTKKKQGNFLKAVMVSFMCQLGSDAQLLGQTLV